MVANMADKNGVLLESGQIIKIEGAYFNKDNGLFKIIYSPGDNCWAGNDYCLHKIKKNGEEVTNKTAFWPLISFCSNTRKNVAAKEHNAKYATIEIVTLP